MFALFCPSLAGTQRGCSVENQGHYCHCALAWCVLLCVAATGKGLWVTWETLFAVGDQQRVGIDFLME